MEPPTPSAALYKGRDKEQIDSIKKLILSETDKQKFKRRGRGAGPGSDSDEDAEGDGEKRGKGAAEGTEGEEGAGGGPAKKVKPKGVWRKGKFIPYEETEEGRYRDRAKERRTGINPDYDGEIEKMVEVDAEKSKYLGGDLKHTHLVKGLDYALLVKIKEEARRKEDEERAARLALKAQAGQLQPGETDFNADEGGSGRPPTIRTYSGRALYAALQAVNRPKPPDFRRVLYEFDLCEDGAGDVPTVLARSNADVEAEGLDADDDLDNRLNYIVDDDFLARLTHNLTQFRLHGRPGKRKKRARDGAADSDAPAKSAKPRVKALDVVDIFAGIQAKPRPLEPGEIHTIPPPPPPLPPSQPPLPPLPYDDGQPPLPPYDDQHPPPPLLPSASTEAAAEWRCRCHRTRAGRSTGTCSGRGRRTVGGTR